MLPLSCLINSFILRVAVLIGIVLALVHQQEQDFVRAEIDLLWSIAFSLMLVTNRFEHTSKPD